MAGSLFDANQSDFLGEGTAAPVTAPQVTRSPLQQQEHDLALSRFNAAQNNVPYGTPNYAGGSATPFSVSTDPNRDGRTSVTARQFTQSPNGTPMITGASYGGTYYPDGSLQRGQAFSLDPQHQIQSIGTPGYDVSQTSPNAPGLAPIGPKNTITPTVGGAGGAGAGGAGSAGLADQVSSARQLGTNFVGYGNQALQNTQNQANGLLAQGQAFSPQAQQVSGGFGVGQRAAAPGMVDPSQIGALNTNVAGQLGKAPTIAAVGNVAGKLGAAPQVNGGNVGMVQTGAAPGSVTPQLGNLGASNADQQGMLSRINGFLDAPQGPSIAQAQLQQSQANNMADLIGAARSGRGGAGSQAQALREAQSAGSAIMSDTAGQAATLRAQEEDMIKNRQLNAIGLGGQMATAQRGQDLGYRGQDLAALQGDQATALGARGQDLTGSMANQGTQLGLEQLRGQLGLGARGQDLSALQGDQGTQAQLATARGQLSLGARGQNLSALQGDQGAQLGARGQNLSALQGNQGTALGARGQDVQARAQDLTALTGDADRGLAAQQLGLQGQLGLSGLGLQAQGQGLQASAQQNALGLGAEGMAQDAINQANRNASNQSIASGANAAALAQQQAAIDAQPSFWEKLALNVTGSAGNALGGGLVGSIFSPSAPAPAPNPYNPGAFGGAGGVY
jgi:hypothetical protein